MNKIWWISLLFILYSLIAVAQEDGAQEVGSDGGDANAISAAEGAGEGDEVYSERGNERLNQLMEIPEVAQRKEQCEQSSNHMGHSSLGECIWAGPGIEDRVKEAGLLADSDAPGDLDAGTLLSLDTMTQKESRAVKALGDYLKQKMREAMYGQVSSSASDQGLRVVDHDVFYNLYETQVSKNVIGAISSFCMEAGESGGKFLIHKTPGKADGSDSNTRNADIKANLEKLTRVSNTAPPSGGNSQQEGGLQANQELPTPVAFTHWMACAGHIPDICLKKGNYTGYTSSDDQKYTVIRACQVNNFLKTARQTLIEVATVKEKMNAHKDGVNVAENVSVYTGKGGDGEKSVDELTTVTSNELMEGAAEGGESLGDVASAEAEQFKNECTPSSLDAEVCQRHILSDEEAKEAHSQLAEYELRTKAAGAKFEEWKNDAESNEAQIKAFLKSEGYSDSDLESLQGQKLAKVASEIEERYEAEREQVIQAMREKIDGRTIKANDPQAATKLQEIAAELDNRPNQMKQLVFFNNIVSGYLEVDKGGEKSRNTLSLQREMGDSAFDPNRGDAGGGGQQVGGVDFEQLEEVTREAASEGSSDDAAGLQLQPQVITDQFLEYDEMKDESGSSGGGN